MYYAQNYLKNSFLLAQFGQKNFYFYFCVDKLLLYTTQSSCKDNTHFSSSKHVYICIIFFREFIGIAEERDITKIPAYSWLFSLGQVIGLPIRCYVRHEDSKLNVWFRLVILGKAILTFTRQVFQKHGAVKNHQKIAF